MSRRARIARVLPLLALALALGACSDAALSATSVETSAIEEFSKQFAVESVECPDDLASEEGATTTCVLVDGQGDAYEMTVTVTAIEDDEASFDLELTAEL